MDRRLGVSLEISTVIFVLFSLTFTKGDFTRVSAIEGDELKLDFRYPSECARVTLRNGMKAPFYDSAHQEPLSLPENQELEFQNETEDNYFLIQFKINPVLRSDVGGYIFTAYGGDGNIVEDTRFGLRVDYPPGKASCEWGERNVVDGWGSMRCKAPAGSFQGQFACYQNGIMVPPKDKPIKDRDNILKQVMWVRYSQSAFCCTVILVGQPVDKCECKDYRWDPYGNLTEPCPVAMVTSHQEASTSSQSPTSIPSKDVTQKTKNIHRANVPFVVVIGILVIIIVGLGIALGESIRKAYQVNKYCKISYSELVQLHVHKDYKRYKQNRT